MIYCIWYPSGGFGHFVNAIISLFGDNFCRPTQDLKIGEDGNSHQLPLVLPKYKTQQPSEYRLPDLVPGLNYTVLIDNGINNESLEFCQVFPHSPVIKMCYDDEYWPVVAYTCITKAMRSSLNKEIAVDLNAWEGNEYWCQREKYFLFLRDHPLRLAWRPTQNYFNLSLKDLSDYTTLIKQIKSFDITLSNFSDTWLQWWQVNKKYYDAVISAKDIVYCLHNDTPKDLTDINDTWTQAVIYYFLWLEFGQEVRHNDYADFFTHTNQIKQWLNS